MKEENMGYHLINSETNEIIGWSMERFETAEGQALIPDTEVPIPKVKDLGLIKSAKINQIRELVREQINNLQWRVERAKEREVIGAEGESVKEVFVARETLRRAGNRAEQEIASLEDEENILNYSFEIAEEDRFVTGVLTKLTFLQRFTTEELVNIQQTTLKNPIVYAWYSMLEVADYINVLDPITAQGIHALEDIGLLSEGRAEEILRIN